MDLYENQFVDMDSIVKKKDEVYSFPYTYRLRR